MTKRGMSRKTRVHMSLDGAVVRLFRLMVPAGQRAFVIERLLTQWCVENYSKARRKRDAIAKELADQVTGLQAVGFEPGRNRRLKIIREQATNLVAQEEARKMDQQDDLDEETGQRGGDL